MKNRSLLFLLLMTAVGCSTYSRRQCEKFDWYQIGHKAALQGESSQEKIQHFQEKCEVRHKVPANQALFNQGFQAGIEILCSPEGGKSLGEAGHLYKGTCPSDREQIFLKSYETARMGYLTRRVAELEMQVQKLQSDMDWRNSKISDLESEARRMSSEARRLDSRSCP